MTLSLPQRTQELLRAFSTRPTLTVEEIRAAALVRAEVGKPRERSPDQLRAHLTEISQRCAALPLLDSRSPDEIIGYNNFGAFD